MELEQVYREQYRPLVGFIRKRLRDGGRAEELAQEVFVRAIQNRPDNPRAWIYVVASNLVRDEARRGAVRRRHLRLIEPPVEPVTEAPLVDEVQSREERRARIRDALAQLSERDRQALLLKEEGLAYPQIAERLGLSPGAVGTTLSRARKRLATIWDRLNGTLEHDDVAR